MNKIVNTSLWFKCLLTRYLIPVIILMIYWSEISGQYNIQTNSYTLNHFSASNKLPGQSIQCIYQDSIGILWLGIESVGLTRYDGKKSTIYQNVPGDSSSLSTNYPQRIIADAKGDLWITTSNGLNHLCRSTGKITRYFAKPESPFGLSNNVLQDLNKDRYGNIWISSENGVNILNPEKKEFITILHHTDYDNPAAYNEISSIHLDPSGNVWIGTMLNGVFMISEKNVQQLHHKWQNQSASSLASDIYEIIQPQKQLNRNEIPSVRAITSNHPDTIWLATQAGLYYYLPKLKNLFHYHFHQPETKIFNTTTLLSVLIDSEDNLWVGSANDGVAIIDLNTSDNYCLNAADYTNNQLSSNAIREIIETSCGFIWIATKFGGLHYYDRRIQTFPLIKSALEPGKGLNDDFVLTILVDEPILWIGTKGGGLNKMNLDTGLFNYYTNDGTPGSLLTNRIEAVVKDHNKTLWIGTDVGLFSKKRNQETFEQHNEIHVRNILLEENYLWIGTAFGLIKFSVAEEKTIPVETEHSGFFNTESNIYITCVLKDTQGIMWIGTYASGLFEYHPDTDILINHSNQPRDSASISGNQIRAIYEDHLKRLWIGTKSDGLNLFDKELREFIRVSSNTSLPSNTVYHILEDDAGSLWLGTHNGISKFNPSDATFTNFSPSYGLQDLIYEVDAFARTTDGYLLMGGNKGFNIFNPDNITVETYQAPIIISNFSIFNESKAVDISEFAEFRLNSQNNYISFEFALLDYSNPDENRYFYQLLPVDEEWINAGTRNFASYTNLKPGNYLFKVLGTNSDDHKSNTPLEIAIIIPAPLWQQPWFIPFAAVVLASLIILGYYLKTTAAKRREVQLKTQVQQRTKDLLNAYQKLEESNKKVEKHNTALQQQKERISRQNLELNVHRQNLELMVADRTRDLEEAKIKAEESDRLKSAFLANMSHEIRTPLNAIMGFIDILETDELPPDERKNINDIIQTNSNGLLQLINDIIDISMIEANQLTIKKEKIEFNKFISDIYYHYQVNADLQKKSVSLRLQTPENKEPLFMHTDPDRTRQILTNLMNNALKFTVDGSITLGYYIDITKNEVVCFVKDTGIGISEDNVKLLFERFMKIEPTSLKVHRGTGLGLSISKHICNLMGGNIWLNSKTGEGTTFYFSLPCV